MKKNKIQGDGVEKFLDLYRNNISINDISKIFNCSKPVLYKFLKSNGIPIREKVRKGRKYYLNENYFESINTEEKAYWLGFLFADGNISVGKSENNLYLRMELAVTDKDHMERFLSCIESNIGLTYRKDKNTFNFRICNFKICKDLMKLGCIPAKTFSLQFPNLRNDLVKHFLRGYFDGDGCVTKRTYGLSAFFLGQPNFLNDLNNILYKENLIRPIKKCSKAECYQITFYNKKDISILYHYLYDNSSIYLNRKYLKFRNEIE